MEPNKIDGYRQMTQAEIDVINLVKRAGTLLLNEYEALALNPLTDKRWLAIAKTDLQTSVMAAVRSIAKPEGI